jgi:hypothetical protein
VNLDVAVRIEILLSRVRGAGRLNRDGVGKCVRDEHPGHVGSDGRTPACDEQDHREWSHRQGLDAPALLLRDVESPETFVSFGEWKSAAAVRSWRALEGY